MIARMNNKQLDDRIGSFMKRMNRKHPDLHLTDTEEVSFPSRDRNNIEWFRTPGRIRS